MTHIYQTKEQVLEKAETIKDKSLREVISEKAVEIIEKKIWEQKKNRKGLLGDMMEKYFFEINPGNISEPDFTVAGVELKTTPLKESSKVTYVSKERLVFSMIDYDTVADEKWETSSFLKKNQRLLLMFYLWLENKSILDYKFKFILPLNLLADISDEDVYQIQKDWEYIVAKINRGEAHSLSEGDTYYLGACTKAANSHVLRDQPRSRIPAKPRAFSFKQQYINYLIQTRLLGQKTNTDSIFKKQRRIETIEDFVKEKFASFVGKTDKEILTKLNSSLDKKSKSYKRLIVNQILGVKSNNIEELEKANVTLRVITLEDTGTLKESISFPAFDYKDLVTQVWYDEENETMADLHLELETKKFLFVVFKKQKGSDEIILEKTMFWNFPMKDLEKAKDVWEKTIELINNGKIVKEVKKSKKGKETRLTYFPGQSFNGVIHIRPHGANKADESDLPVRDELTGKKAYTKQCFWLNATYIQKVIEENN
jgi:DNA mismatch repair endonuclease MutH